MKAERIKSDSKTDLSKVHIYILGSVHTWGGGGGGGEVLAVKVLTVLLADQHRKLSCLSGASSCYWSQGTASHTKRSVSAGTCFFFFFFKPGQGERLPVKKEKKEKEKGAYASTAEACEIILISSHVSISEYMS